VKVSADFQQGISNIGAVSGASAAQMGQIRDAALRIGKDTAFSASEAAGAMEELVKAGVPIPAVLGGAADATVALAASTGIAMPEAATLASNAMNQFGLSAKALPGVVDHHRGRRERVSDRRLPVRPVALRRSAPSRTSSGLSFGETATAIAELGQAGIVGSDAGTSLKTMLLNLTPSSKSAAAAFQDLGITTKDGANRFFDAQGKMKSLADIQEILRQGTAGMSEEQKNLALKTAFGTDAIRAASIMAGQGAKGYDSMSAAMSKVSAADVAAARLNNLKGSMQALQGSLETVAINVGSVLLPALKFIVDGVNRVVGGLAGASPAFQTFAAVGGLIAGAFALISGGVLLFLPQILNIGTAFRTVVGAITPLISGGGALAGVFRLLTGPIGIIIGLLVTAYATSSQFRTAINGLVTTLIGLGASLISGLMPAFQQLSAGVTSIVTLLATALAPILTQLVTALVPVLVAVFKVLSTVITAVVAAVVPLVTQLVGALMPVFTQLVSTVLPVVVTLFRSVAAAVLPLVTALAGALVPIIRTVAQILLAVLIPTIRALLPVVTAVFGAIVPIIQAALQIVVGVINTVVGVLTGNWKQAWSGLSGIVSGAFNLVVAVVRGAVGIIGSALAAIGGIIGTVWNGIWNALPTPVRTALSGSRRVHRRCPRHDPRHRRHRRRRSIVAAWNAYWARLGAVVHTVFAPIVGFISGVINNIRDRRPGRHSPSSSPPGTGAMERDRQRGAADLLRHRIVHRLA
jgi:TP901 family phage tail tape measure protein